MPAMTVTLLASAGFVIVALALAGRRYLRRSSTPRLPADQRIVETKRVLDRLRIDDPAEAARLERAFVQEFTDGLTTRRTRAPSGPQAALEYARLVRDQIIGWTARLRELRQEADSAQHDEAQMEAEEILEENRTNLLWVSPYLPPGHPWRTDAERG